MFVYSLAGLELEGKDSEPIEIEESETTARSAVYQVFGRFFGSQDRDHFERAREGLWRKELADASTLLTFPMSLPDAELPEDITPESYITELRRVFDDKLIGSTYAEGTTADLARAYEYYGLKVRDDGPPIDHITIGCDYMQYLTFKDAAASSDRLRSTYRRAQSDFLGRHLSVWTKGLDEAVSGTTTLSFVEQTVASLSAFVEADAAHI